MSKLTKWIKKSKKKKWWAVAVAMALGAAGTQSNEIQLLLQLLVG